MRKSNNWINRQLTCYLLSLGITLSQCNIFVSAEENSGWQEIGHHIYYNSEDNQYKRYDPETGEYQAISIFDDDNIKSSQFGASQVVFKTKFNILMKNPYILEELQNYYPIEGFSSEEEATYFYERYFKLIFSRGCGYAAAANFVFRQFEGKEQEFYDTFSFPMYIVDEHGNLDFNYEVFMLKFFNYSILEMGNSEEKIKNSMLKDLYHFQIETYINSEEYRRKKPNDFENWTEEERKQWKEFEEARTQKFHDLFEKWKNASNEFVNLGIPTDASFGYLYAFLKRYRLDSITEVEFDNHYEENDIVASDGFNLYSEDENISSVNDVKSHYIYIVGTTEDGKLIVSSWGKKYIFDDQNASYTTRVQVKIRKNG